MPKYDFTRKMNDFDIFIKIVQQCRGFGKNNCCHRLWMVAQSANNRPIWSQSDVIKLKNSTYHHIINHGSWLWIGNHIFVRIRLEHKFWVDPLRHNDVAQLGVGTFLGKELLQRCSLHLDKYLNFNFKVQIHGKWLLSIAGTYF